ncbi:hypothetical protein [Chthonobacter albigriseus]|uniref:hypothetical protein n=1 Tax=Chthonobacter albigriseus TaxID=1683161 RepID=UPI0015EED5A7|nr:hypothetical protein [Chthonobacter albigriseus]
MNPIRQMAFESVARGTGFAGLAIVCILVGLCWNPPLAAKTGGILCLMTTLTLAAKGYTAASRDHRLTEAWLLLAEGERPPAAVAQRITASALQEAYYSFAVKGAAISIAMFGLAVVFAAAIPPEMLQLKGHRVAAPISAHHSNGSPDHFRSIAYVRAFNG